MKKLRPTILAKWLGLAYAGGMILFLFWSADALDVALLGILLTPWILGPAGLAAFGAKQSNSRVGAWAFFILEASVIGSTIWLLINLFVVAPDPQNGIAFMLFPLWQYAVVSMFFIIAMVFGWRTRRAETRDRLGA